MLSCGTKEDRITRRLPVEVPFGVGTDPAAFSGPSLSQRACWQQDGADLVGLAPRSKSQQGALLAVRHGMKGLAGQFLLFQ